MLVGSIMDTMLHFGHPNFDMFSTTPTTLSPTFTIMAPSRPARVARHSCLAECQQVGSRGYPSPSPSTDALSTHSSLDPSISMQYLLLVEGSQRTWDSSCHQQRLETIQIPTGGHSLPDIPWSMMVGWLRPQRSMSRTPTSLLYVVIRNQSLYSCQHHL